MEGRKKGSPIRRLPSRGKTFPSTTFLELSSVTAFPAWPVVTLCAPRFSFGSVSVARTDPHQSPIRIKAGGGSRNKRSRPAPGAKAPQKTVGTMPRPRDLHHRSYGYHVRKRGQKKGSSRSLSEVLSKSSFLITRADLTVELRGHAVSAIAEKQEGMCRSSPVDKEARGGQGSRARGQVACWLNFAPRRRTQGRSWVTMPVVTLRLIT